MSVSDISAEDLILAVLVVLTLLSAYNTFATARKNMREEKQLHEQPIARIAQHIGEHGKALTSDKQRITELEQRVDDTRRGMLANCAGVIALINHALHDGNTDEMEKALELLQGYLTDPDRK